MLPALRRSHRFQGKPPWSPLSVDAPYDAVQWLRGIDDVYMLDKVGKGTDRILNGGPGLQQGRCYDFDGTDDYVEGTSPFSAGTDFKTTGFSVACWVATTRAATQGIVTLGTSTGTNYMVQIVFIATTGQVRVLWHRADNDATGRTHITADAGDAVTADEITHIAVTYDGSGTPSTSNTKIYVNGSAASLVTTGGSTFHAYQQDKISFGSTGGAGGNYLDGKMFGAVIYNDVLTAAEVTYLHDIGLTGVGTNPTLANAQGQYLMDEQSGTTAYDSSGNGNDLTLYGGLAHSTQDIHSWHNRYGYKLSGAVFLPKDYGDSGEVDINGDPLDYSGRAPFHAKLVDSYCGDFDGTDDHVSVGSTGISVKTVAFRIRPDSVTSHTDYVIDLNGTDYITVVNGTVTVNGFAAATTTIYVDGAVSSTVTTTDFHSVVIVSDTAFTASNLVFGKVSSNYLNGRLFDVRLYTSELTANNAAYIHDKSGTDAGTGDLAGWWPMAEGGTSTTAHNVIANANHGTCTNITASTFWSASQDKLAYNANHGFRDAFGIRVPALLGTSNSADGGGAISNPAGSWHNDAESKIQRNPFDIPGLLTHQIGFDADTAFDVRASEFTEKDQEWVYRESEIKLTNYTIFRQALVSDNRDDAWTYYKTVPTLNTEKTAAWKFEDSDWSSYTAEDVVGSHDATDASSASDNPLGGKSGRMLEMYGTCDMAISPTLGTAVTAFTVSGFINVNDTADDFMMFQLAGPSLEVGFESTTGKAYFTYNGTTIKGTTTLVGSTWYHVMAGINEHGHMTLFVNGDLENTGTATILANTNNQWSAGYGSSITTQEHIDEVYFFEGKRLTANVASRLNENYISSAGEFAKP